MHSELSSNQPLITEIGKFSGLVDSWLVAKYNEENPANQVTLYGEGLGDKVRELLTKSDTIKKAGFDLYPRAVLGITYLSEILDFNRISFDISPKPNTKLELSHPAKNDLQAISNSFAEHRALVVRSSAVGDAKGTGVYETEFCINNPAKLEEAVLAVISSYFTEAATIYREKKNLASGMAISIEPLLGKISTERYVEQEVIAPDISGFGYTTLAGAPLIKLGEGLARAVNDHSSVCLELRPILDSEHEKLMSRMRKQPYMIQLDEMLIKKARALNSRRSENQPVFNLETGALDEVTIWGGKYSLSEFDAQEMFYAPADTIERMVGVPQYFEWCVVKEENSIRKYITQIADFVTADPADFYYELNSEDIVLSLGAVRGSGRFNTNAIFEVSNPNFQETLYNFNKDPENKDYILKIDSRLFSRMFSGGQAIDISYYDNASAIVIVNNGSNANSLYAHLPTLAYEMGIIVALAALENYDHVVSEEGLKTEELVQGAVYLHRGNFEAIADEGKQRFVIKKLPQV